MKLKHLEAALSSITREFPNPKVTLEQYPTSAHLTACVITLAMENGDLGTSMSCLDLGCGTGMLSIGAAFVCDLVLSVDCDEDAMEMARENAEHVELEDTIQFIQAQVRTKQNNATTATSSSSSSSSSNNNHRGNGGRGGRGGRHKKGRGGRGGRGGGGRGRGGGRGSQSGVDTKSILIMDGNDGIPLRDNCVDTVLTNPPFGTKHNAGIDVQFLRTACRLAKKAVYSFHKRSTRAFLIKTIQDDWGYQAQVAAEMEFDISNMYQFHKQKTKDVEVDLIRVIISDDDNNDIDIDIDNTDNNSNQEKEEADENDIEKEE